MRGEVFPLLKTRSRPRSPKPKALRRPRMNRFVRVECPKHLERLAGLPSVVSGLGPCVVHHLRTSASTACGGRRSGDDETVPLTHAEHVDLHNSLDGEDGWWARQGVDGNAAARRFWIETHSGEMP